MRQPSFPPSRDIFTMTQHFFTILLNGGYCFPCYQVASMQHTQLQLSMSPMYNYFLRGHIAKLEAKWRSSTAHIYHWTQVDLQCGHAIWLEASSKSVSGTFYPTRTKGFSVLCEFSQVICSHNCKSSTTSFSLVRMWIGNMSPGHKACLFMTKSRRETRTLHTKLFYSEN